MQKWKKVVHGECNFYRYRSTFMLQEYIHLVEENYFVLNLLQCIIVHAMFDTQHPEQIGFWN